ncbi:MAG: 16S rRNA (cytosine(967)-C(5))-methyltransferase RsmB [Desulfobulbaceae bacterium]|nr:16S rRNA (cytosine(967)-C(5))-methyltransferase RsmB [Desulfobulbaceae bacterium]
MRANPRAAAIEILCQWAASRAPVEQVGDQVLRGVAMADQRDRQLVWSLVLGVIRWQRYLDWVVARFSQHSLAKMKPRTLQALRVGIFQLLFFDRVPAAAAINETVGALKNAGQPKWLTGFVNGLLRNVDRQRATLPGLHGSGDEMAPAIRFSHPDWLVARWQKRYGGPRAEAILRVNNKMSPLTLRLETDLVQVDDFISMLGESGVAAERGRFAPAAVRIDDWRGVVTELPGYGEGWFQVQDEAAQLVTLLLAPFGEGRYLDGCAGLGGKTTHLARLLPPAAQVVAVDPSPRRVALLKENLARLQLQAGVEVVAGELASLYGQEQSFAGILIDAPCSGLGVTRRHPDIRWNRTEEELARYQETQRALLAAAAPLLRPGGVLVYATCSMEPEEDDQVVEHFLAAHPDFALTDARPSLPAAAAGLVDEAGLLRTAPDLHDLDGFFAARLVKTA